MDKLKRKWLKELGFPSYTKASGQLKLISTFSHEEFDGEWYAQENGGGKTQRVLMAFPKNLKGKVPAVAVPFYYPEAMLGFNPKTSEKLEYFSGIEMMLHLLRRGYAVISADAYHLTYLYSDKEIGDFTRWQESADALRRENPNYSGVGKLVDDTKLLIDAFVSDARVNSDKIGIAGHSLGGKMAFYTGCLDERVKVILASDFGIGFNQTNWDDDWYFGKATVQKFIETNTFNSELLTIAKKPFCLIAGEYDTDESYEIISKAKGYTENSGLVKFINHKSGHRPPEWALNEGYDYIDKWLK